MQEKNEFMNYQCLGVSVNNCIFSDVEKIFNIENQINSRKSGKVYSEDDIQKIAEALNINAKESFVWIPENEKVNSIHGVSQGQIYLSFKEKNEELNKELEKFRFAFGNRSGKEKLISEEQHYEFIFRHFMTKYKKHIMKDCFYYDCFVRIYQNEVSDEEVIALEWREQLNKM